MERTCCSLYSILFKISFFDDLRHRRPVMQPDSPAAPQGSFHSISIIGGYKAPPCRRGVCQLATTTALHLYNNNQTKKRRKKKTKRSCNNIFMAAWRSGNVVGRINEVALRRARLVLGWVTVFGGQTTSVFHQATQANSASYPQRDEK